MMGSVYVLPRSWTWWAGMLAFISGVLRLAEVRIPYVSDVVRPVLDALFAVSDPALMVLMGLAIIGGRAHGERIIRRLDEIAGGEATVSGGSNEQTG